MYSGSTEFNNLIEKSGGNALITRFKFSNFSIEKFTKLEYYGGSNSSDDIAIGTTNMAYLDVSTITDKIITNQEFLFEVGMKLSDGTVEYAPIGYFKVQKPDENEDTVDFTAYDRMHRFEKPYVSSLAYPTDSEKVLNELCTMCGVELATPIASPITITNKLDGYTCREILGYIAGIHGFFACFDRYGKLNLRWYSETPIEKRIGLIWSLTKSQSNYTVEKITIAKDTETTYTGGTGISGINHSNPYGTQAIADSIYASLGGFSYRPCEISMLDDIRLDPWDMLKVTYLDGSVLTIPVMALEHSFTSGETRVKSFGKTDTENEYNYSGPVTQAMDRMATELLVANRIIATKVDAEWVNAHTVTADKLEATNARVETLETSKLNASDLSAEVAKLGYATVDNLKAANAKIEDLDVNKLSVADAKVQYAEIDFSNVGTQVVSTSMIKDGAVTNEKVGNLSANKITSGTIDASKITVTNLNADNLTVGTINGKLIGNGSVDLDKLAEEVPTKEYLDSVEKSLQNQIDGAIETFTKTEIPTLNNEPANAWEDNETRKKHIGDICYVVNPTSSADGYCYRFADLGTNGKPNYSWVLIKDSDVTKALQDIIDINGEITGIKQFDTEISSWKTDTDAELSSLKSRTTTLETDIGSKVESSVFNELKQTVDENSSSITSLSTAVSKKADSSTVETLTNTVNSVKQTADTNTSSISSMQTTIQNKADSSTVTALSNKTSELEQSLNGFKTTVSDTYATKTALNNYSTTSQMNSAIEQTANSITSTVSSTYTTKTEFNNLQIGGRNLIINSSRYRENSPFKNTSAAKDGILMVPIDVYMPCVPGETYTFQCKTDGKWGDHITDGTGGGKTHMYVYLQTANEVGTAKFARPQHLYSDSYNGKTGRGVWTYTIPTDNEYVRIVFRFDIHSDGSTPYTVNWWDLKAELGNKATDWTPAPEDVDADISKVDGKFANYSTTAQMNNAITQAITAESNSIRLEVSGTYTTKTEFNELQIGGRNLIRAYYIGHFDNGSTDASKYITSGKVVCQGNGAHTGFRFDSINCYEPSTQYVLSGYITVTSKSCNNIYVFNGKRHSFISFKIDGIAYSNPFDIERTDAINILNDGKPHFFELGYETNANIPADVDVSYTYIQLNKNNTTQINYEINGFKLEKGNKATDWSPAPEDVEAKFNNYATTASLDLYIKKDPTTGELKSAIEAIADDITLNASGTINISGNKSVNINGNLFTLTSTNTTISADGTIRCDNLISSNATITGGSINIETSTLTYSAIKLSYGDAYLKESPYSIEMHNPNVETYNNIDAHGVSIIGNDNVLINAITDFGVEIRKGVLYVESEATVRFDTGCNNISIWHPSLSRRCYPAMYTNNPVTFDWDGSVLRIYVDNTIVASWIWDEQRWE